MKRGNLTPYLYMAALSISGSSAEEAVLRKVNSATRSRNGDTLLARITPCLKNGKTVLVQLARDTHGGLAIHGVRSLTGRFTSASQIHISPGP